MDVPLFLLVTLLAHACLAAVLVAHARHANRDPGNWPYLTLAVGVVGVVGYVATADSR